MIFWDDQSSVVRIQQALKNDEIVLASGDTVLGLWGNITLAAFAKLNAIKLRNDKPYLITIGSVAQLPKFIDQSLTDAQQMLMQTCWPGPVTIIFKARADLPSWMVGVDGTIALRVPDHEGLLTALKNFDGLFSTSANIAGHPIASCIDQMDATMVSQVAVVCIQSDQQCYPVNPSTIIDCSTGKIEVVRAGAYKVENLKDFLT